MLSVQQDLAAAANPCFSFSSPPHIMNECSNDIEFGAWTETIRGGRGNGGVFRNYGYDGSPSGHGFSWLASPPSEEGAGSPASQEDYKDHQKHLCSDSRAQAISQHRQEMISMVDDMPETIYELSLRDLMELPEIANSIQESPGKGREDKIRSAEEQKKANKGRRVSRSKSMDNGAFLLKVFFPVLLGGRRKCSVTSRSSLPKPMLTDDEKGMLEKNTDGKSWKENELSYLSQNNDTSSQRRRKSGCYSFFQSSKNKN